MNRIKQKTIAHILIMLMLMTPLTGMAMQWTAQPPEMNHSDDMQMMQQGHESMVQQDCNMNPDCQELCNTTQQCSNTSLSILNGSTSTIASEANRMLISSLQSLQFSLVLSELFRPPRA